MSVAELRGAAARHMSRDFHQHEGEIDCAPKLLQETHIRIITPDAQNNLIIMDNFICFEPICSLLGGQLNHLCLNE